MVPEIGVSNPLRPAFFMKTLYHRHGLGQFLLDLGLLGEGVEVGCAYGGFSERILEQWPGKLHLVDPWIRQDPAVYREITNHTVDWNGWYENAKRLMARFGPRAELHRMFSVEGAKLFPDNSLDFVYLDGNHSLEAVTEDLESWVPKIKSGGLVSGHDYGNQTVDGHWCFVEQALTEWHKKHPIDLFRAEGGCSSWYFFK